MPELVRTLCLLQSMAYRQAAWCTRRRCLQLVKPWPSAVVHGNDLGALVPVGARPLECLAGCPPGETITTPAFSLLVTESRTRRLVPSTSRSQVGGYSQFAEQRASALRGLGSLSSAHLALPPARHWRDGDVSPALGGLIRVQLSTFSFGGPGIPTDTPIASFCAYQGPVACAVRTFVSLCPEIMQLPCEAPGQNRKGEVWHSM